MVNIQIYQAIYDREDPENTHNLKHVKWRKCQSSFKLHATYTDTKVRSIHTEASPSATYHNFGSNITSFQNALRTTSKTKWNQKYHSKVHQNCPELINLPTYMVCHINLYSINMELNHHSETARQSISGALWEEASAWLSALHSRHHFN